MSADYLNPVCNDSAVAWCHRPKGHDGLCAYGTPAAVRLTKVERQQIEAALLDLDWAFVERLIERKINAALDDNGGSDE